MIQALHPILWNKKLTKKNKIKYEVKTLIRIINKAMSQKILSTEMMNWGRSSGLTLLDLVRNETIKQRMKIQNTIIEFLGEKQLKWY